MSYGVPLTCGEAKLCFISHLQILTDQDSTDVETKLSGRNEELEEMLFKFLSYHISIYSEVYTPIPAVSSGNIPTIYYFSIQWECSLYNISVSRGNVPTPTC